MKIGAVGLVGAWLLFERLRREGRAGQEPVSCYNHGFPVLEFVEHRGKKLDPFLFIYRGSRVRAPGNMRSDGGS